ncbi:hypothetical protein S7335_2314 [Synechococcus sp. PCC 7335]|uniref:hypothetical protein n=1 Tax=Synechococcus sp. (strain ATCC 29403 / PCC 7335) TaxID=91464 RepID=UPI00017EBBF8|nr:hypothetical protein [Synechococcus sp. PCC 7335]EDX84617.1 hypothetical protein S7335_2314 [Synechococcus sp. PCC 7335]
MFSKENWYIVKQDSQACKIVSEQELEALTETDGETASPAGAPTSGAPEAPIQWGPFETQEQAIAKRIGLIRAGKCQPVI